ncbi:MAG: hypothetical protein D6759_13910, partial [Chloroflexi bacterium]
MARLHLDTLLGKEPLIVYQMGKVGSSTVVASLEALSLDSPIYHIHTLTWEGIRSGERIYRAIYGDSRPPSFSRMKHLLASRHLRRQLDRGVRGPRWKVITLVRDPIARNISDFFQLIDWWLPHFLPRYEAGEATIEEAIATFLERYYHDEPLNWFDIELKASLGIDVFATPFPKSTGYQVYQGEGVDLLVLKLERLDECAPEAFRAFLGVERFELIRANVSSDKMYGDAYRAFVKAIRLPDSYIEQMYTSRYVRHFYSDEEI